MSEQKKGFLSQVVEDIKENTKAQHEVDKARLTAVKAESKAQWEEAKARSSRETRKAVEQAKRDEQIAAAQARTAEAEERIAFAQSGK